MERGDLSRAAVGILRNRLQAHVMPFFKDRPPSTIDASVLEGFVQRLTDAKLSTTTMSQYLVVVRKLLKLAVRQKLLNEVPEMPQVRVVHRPRGMLTLDEYAAVVLTQDWHPANHSSFASNHPGKAPFESLTMSYGPQTLWPDHCIQATYGAALHDGLDLPRADIDTLQQAILQLDELFLIVVVGEFNAGKYAPYVGDEVRIDIAIEAIQQ